MAKLKNTTISGNLKVDGDLDCRNSELTVKNLKTTTLNGKNLVGEDGIFESDDKTKEMTTKIKLATHADEADVSEQATNDSDGNAINTTYAKLASQNTFKGTCIFNNPIQAGSDTFYGDGYIQVQNSQFNFPTNKTGVIAVTTDIPPLPHTPDVIYHRYDKYKSAVCTPDAKPSTGYRYVYHGGTITYYGTPISNAAKSIEKYIVTEVESGYWGEPDLYTMTSAKTKGNVFLDINRLIHFSFLTAKPYNEYFSSTLQVAIRDFEPAEGHTIEPITNPRQFFISYNRLDAAKNPGKALGAYIYFDSTGHDRTGTVNYTVTSSYTLTKDEWDALKSTSEPIKLPDVEILN